MKTPISILIGCTLIAASIYLALSNVRIEQNFDQRHTSIKTLDKLDIIGLSGGDGTNNTVKGGTVYYPESLIKIETAKQVLTQTAVKVNAQ